MYKVYELVCPNGKKYYGISKQEKMYRRWNYGNGYSKNIPLMEDIIIYGDKNFEHNIVGVYDTKDEAMLCEGYYILKNKTNLPEFGYNSHTNKNTFMKYYKRVYLCEETGETFASCSAAAAFCKRTKQAVNLAIIAGRKCGDYTFRPVWINKYTNELANEEEMELIKVYLSL